MCCGVWFEDYAVMGTRALRQQSADFEVWLKRWLRHGPWTRARPSKYM